MTTSIVMTAPLSMETGAGKLAQPLSNLPALRQELAIHPGPTADDGAPSWTLHDPADNRFFQISWPAFEILSRWHLGNVAALKKSIAADTTLVIGSDEIEDVFEFCAQHHLLAASTAEHSERLARAAAASSLSRPMWLLKNYLFLRVPFVRPMGFLRRFSPCVDFMFSAQFAWAIAAIALIGLYLVAQQWDRFTHTFAAYSNWQGVLGIGLALSVAKVAHELGHAFAAYRHGCRVPQMGVAFMVLLPMLYTDTNEAWKLPSRRARMQIAAAGMATEIALAACATLAWVFLPDGPLRAGVFLLATSTWLITLAINLSPFMRFDGYFLLSDYLQMPNLHDRAFALGRWHLRESLFGWGEPEPEQFSAAKQRFLIAFAYLTWLYRLFLFLGIALLVYHVFFKALGVFLMAVELAWFIGWPICRELKVWWQARSLMRWNWPSLRSLIVVFGVLLLVCLPWPRGVHAPAVLGAENAQWIYAPVAGQVQAMDVRVGQSVSAGQVLANLASPDLAQSILLVQARERDFQWQLQQQAFDARLQERGALLRQRWQAAREELSGLQLMAQQLQLRANFDGAVVSLNPALRSGLWVARGERVMQIAANTGLRVDAYVGEADLANIRVGDSASFIADEAGQPKVDCVVANVDQIALADLPHPALASPYGGAIAANVDRHGRVLPQTAQFRVSLDQCHGLSRIAYERAGVVRIGRVNRSFVGDWWGSAMAVLRREAGF